MFEVAVMKLRNPIKDVMAHDRRPNVGETGRVTDFSDGSEYPAKCTKVNGNLYDVAVYHTSLDSESITIEV